MKNIASCSFGKDSLNGNSRRNRCAGTVKTQSPAEVQGTGNRAARLEYGAVIGTVEIVDCVPVENLVDSLNDRERLLGDYSPGRFAWVLENPVVFDEPFPARGKQGWWNWEERK